MNYKDERTEGVACCNADCNYQDETYEQNCSLEKGGDPASNSCEWYKPETKTP